MATIATHIAALPPILKEKIKTAAWLVIVNELLERLSSENCMVDQKFTRGVIVKYKKWITTPSNYRRPIKLYDPQSPDQKFPFEETDSKLMLTQHEVLEETDPNAGTAFTNSVIGSIDINIVDAEENTFADYLLVVTAGALISNTYLIAGNDASAGGVTRLYYQVPLSSALDVATGITAANLISPDYYLLLKFWGSFVPVTATNDEIAINNNWEFRFMKVGLMALGYERLGGFGNESEKWTRSLEATIMKMRSELISTIGKGTRARYWPGLDDREYGSDDDEDSEE